MKTRKLGQSSLRISALALGGNVFGWNVDESRAFDILDAYVAAGGNFIDTADIYSVWAPGHQGGESETVIGRWLKSRGNRGRVLIATKVGMAMPWGKGLSRKHIMKSVEGSLKRLQTDFIDLYQSHQDDLETPQEETLSAFSDLIEQGKVRVLGASNFSGTRFSEALALSVARSLPRYESMQPRYNLYDRHDFENELEPVCRENTVGVITYFSLASGFLSGKYRSEKDIGQSVRGPRMTNYLNERGFRILSALDSISKELSATPTQVAIAWLLAQPTVTAPIASATTTKQLEDLVGGTALELSQESLRTLEQASA